MGKWYDKEKGIMACGCINHGVYTWEMPCPLWREKIHDCIREWHEGHEDAHNVLPEYLVEHLNNKLGITEEMYYQWVEDGDN